MARPNVYPNPVDSPTAGNRSARRKPMTLSRLFTIKPVFHSIISPPPAKNCESIISVGFLEVISCFVGLACVNVLYVCPKSGQDSVKLRLSTADEINRWKSRPSHAFLNHRVMVSGLLCTLLNSRLLYTLLDNSLRYSRISFIYLDYHLHESRL